MIARVEQMVPSFWIATVLSRHVCGPFAGLFRVANIAPF